MVPLLYDDLIQKAAFTWISCPNERSPVYGDNVFEKHGINRDRTGDGEKPRCLCGKRGIFNRDGAANYQTT